MTAEAEAIAKVMADLRAGRGQWLLRHDRLSHKRGDGQTDPADRVAFGKWRQYVEDVAADAEGPVIDATAIYNANDANGHGGVALYEDHPCIAPPWPTFSIAYARPTGQVRVASFHVVENPQQAGRIQQGGESIDFRTFTADLDANRDHTQPGPWATENPVDWDRVRWLIDGFLWIGGRHNGRPMLTQGPIFHWKFAVYEDGSPADLHWVRFHDEFAEEDAPIQASHLVALGALNFLNCRNVDIVDPQRPNAERKRILRTGVRVSELAVFPTGKATRSADGTPVTGGMPLGSVRGNFGHYGACCAHHPVRGLLFGKYEGKFWRPQRARGSADHGTIAAQSFTLNADGE